MPILKTIQTKDYFLIFRCAVRSHLSPSKGVPVLFLSFLYLSTENNYNIFCSISIHPCHYVQNKIALLNVVV